MFQLRAVKRIVKTGNDKVEMILKKADTRVWNVLEATDQDFGYNLTFGVGGRTGTIGSRAPPVLDADNRLRA